MKRVVSVLAVALCLSTVPNVARASGISPKSRDVRCGVHFSHHGIFYIGKFVVRTRSGSEAVGVWETKDRRIRVHLRRRHRRAEEEDKFLTTHRPRPRLVTCRAL